MAGFLPSTQSLLSIQSVRDDIIITKTGQFCLILRTTSVNFDLLSEAEQDAMIAAYAQMINSLTFPVQIVIHTRRKDITNYINYLEGFEKRQPIRALREQIGNYKRFVQQLVVQGNVLFKNFYIVIPYQAAETKKTSDISLLVARLTKKDLSETVNPQRFKDAKTHLNEKKEELLNLLARMGIKAQQLTTQQILRLFYEIYNPTQSTRQHLDEALSDYATTIVKPVIE